MLKQMLVIMVGKQTTESSTRIVPSINIFINICCGLQISKAIVYASLESRCVLRYIRMVVLGAKPFCPFISLFSFSFPCCFCLTGTQSY